ncbi:EthD family reductase [Rhodococcus sp. MSC1_016]|jgi:uncharacterized protein (TIGR02118 family)/steroid delta-isomerase-like uncharacterized protein|uniref:EthD family reductase n=1 Tax=Rhodococcus sp. MSC1_016 TaxID=2909266 RepID=UPI0027E18FBE|nr:EthD family reductase [Rhodococcus sp. MSC1_016]
MHKLVVLYPEPTDKAAFRDYYETTHLPLAAKLPGLRDHRYSYDVHGVGGESPYFALFEAAFDSAADMQAALESEQGQAVAADVPNYATGGAQIIHYIPEPALDPRDVVVRYLERWSNHDVDGIVDMFADDGVYTDPSLGGRQITKSELGQFLEDLFKAAPDLTLSILSAVADGPHTAVATWRAGGTAIGPNATSEGRLDFFGGDHLTLDPAGKIVWTTAIYDQNTFLTQAGYL